MNLSLLLGLLCGLTFAIAFVVLGYPPLFAVFFGIIAGLSWMTFIDHYNAPEMEAKLPSYMEDINEIAKGIENLGSGGRFDVRNRERRNEYMVKLAARKAEHRKRLAKHHGRPVTFKDRFEKWKKQYFPVTVKDPDAVIMDPKSTPEQIEAAIEQKLRNMRN